MTDKVRRIFKRAAAALLVAAIAFAVVTGMNLMPLPPSLPQVTADIQKTQFLDRNGVPLNVSYLNYWNVQAQIPLHQIPDLMQKMFVLAEDKHFFSHHGIDWSARLMAAYQNIKNRRIVRGASTLSEQVVRMIHPRPRTLFSKWVEGIDAFRLERRFSKADILEFYLNQVPYASNRRGVLQASRYYFSKTPDRLSIKEMAALAVLVRAPSLFDPYRYPERLDQLIQRQMSSFLNAGVISEHEFKTSQKQKIRLTPPKWHVSAEHFLNYLRQKIPLGGSGLVATLDASVQNRVQRLARSRLAELKHRKVGNVGILVLDRRTGEVLAWVNERSDRNDGWGHFDAVLEPRQAASAQKPFLYALALMKGWTAATVINDEPLSRPVALGVHHFKNYSSLHYGDITLRQALGNSLNIPAVKTIEFVGVSNYLDFLRQAGFSGLEKEASFYGEGLALGNAEVSLFDLSRAYLMLANMGIYKPILVLRNGYTPNEKEKRLIPETIASLIGDILSDPFARQLEFGRDSILNFPVQTAVKTGTSTDFRDAWAMGYNADYVVGIWMGNLSYEPMAEVTGAVGPALLLRSVFTELTRNEKTAPLFLSPDLERKIIGENSELFDPSIKEVFFEEEKEFSLLRPEESLLLAVDPRIPAAHQAYRFSVNFVPENGEIVWIVDDKEVKRTTAPSYLWPLERGSHTVYAVLELNGTRCSKTPTRSFHVR